MSVLEELKDDVVQSAKQGEHNFWGLARALDEFVSHTNLYEGEPPGKQLEKLLEIAKLGRRKAYYLIEIYRAFSKLEIPRKRLADIGWTKLSILAPHVDYDNVQPLLQLAEQHTVDGLKALFVNSIPRPHALTFRFRKAIQRREACAARCRRLLQHE